MPLVPNRLKFLPCKLSVRVSPDRRLRYAAGRNADEYIRHPAASGRLEPVANHFWPAQPKFPEGGQTLSCPHCGKESLFRQNDLTYRKESFKRAASS
jgi:hypothetical protein